MSANERCAVVRWKSSFGRNEVYGCLGDDGKIFTPAQAKKIAADLWSKSGVMASVRVYASYAEAVRRLQVSPSKVFS
jgi:hypothetical protein